MSWQSPQEYTWFGFSSGGMTTRVWVWFSSADVVSSRLVWVRFDSHLEYYWCVNIVCCCCCQYYCTTITTSNNNNHHHHMLPRVKNNNTMCSWWCWCGALRTRLGGWWGRWSCIQLQFLSLHILLGIAVHHDDTDPLVQVGSLTV